MSEHVLVYHDRSKWAAVPANNGGNGPVWQWGDELLVGFTRGVFVKTDRGHQCSYEHPFESWLARSRDGGESWEARQPTGYAGDLNTKTAAPVRHEIDFASDGFVMRVEGAGYHGNEAARWFHSGDRGVSWRGPYGLTGLLSHPELARKEFTSRTAYIVDGALSLSAFLTVRDKEQKSKLNVAFREKTFLARTSDGGESFTFVSWVVPWSDPYRAVMPAPVRMSEHRLLAAVRRKSGEHNWIDCFASEDNGVSWSFLSKVGDTETDNRYNGNPPALILMEDGRLCSVYGNRSDRQMVARYSSDAGMRWSDPQVLREDFQSANGHPDLGYARLFQRTDGRLVAVYFWCTAERPQTHIAATVFQASAE